MNKQNEKRSQQEEPKPGSMSSYNNRPDNREGQVEETAGEKDESRVDRHDSNLKENAPSKEE